MDRQIDRWVGRPWTAVGSSGLLWDMWTYTLESSKLKNALPVPLPRQVFFYLFGLHRRSPDALWTDSDIAGSRYYAGESSVLDVSYFLKFLCFSSEAIWTAQALSKYTFEGKLHRFAVFRFRFFRLSARVGRIHEKHSFYRSDFPEWRIRPHNNTIRVVPGCFFAFF